MNWRYTTAVFMVGMMFGLGLAVTLGKPEPWTADSVVGWLLATGIFASAALVARGN